MSVASLSFRLVCLPIMLIGVGISSSARDGSEYVGFYGTVNSYQCESSQRLGKVCILKVSNQEVDSEGRLKFIGIIFDDGFDFQLGSYVSKDSDVFIDMSYLDKVDNPGTLNFLSRKFGSKYSYYQHLNSSSGGYEDVVTVLRRD